MQLSWDDTLGAHEVTIDGPTTLGSAPSLDVVIADPSVSHFHVEIDPRAEGTVIRDLGSTNKTLSGSLIIREVVSRDDIRLTLGRIDVMVRRAPDTVNADIWQRAHFPPRLVGRSVIMRTLFQRMYKLAQTDETVLIQGETGTGKELVAEAIHEHSGRFGGTYRIVDCGSFPPQMLESELFGHAKGSFTGAATAHIGLLESANGGTVFLDEIGEMPLEMQPKLLRALDSRMIRRLGETQYRPIDVRVISASHRDLREEVNLRRFREDLYFRLAVFPLRIPPLRDRRDDIPVLVAHFLKEYENPLAVPDYIMESLAARPWSGNVRELRNMVKRAMVNRDWEQSLSMDVAPIVAPASEVPDAPVVAEHSPRPQDLSGSLSEARDRVIDQFEHDYAVALMKRHRGDFYEAAAEAGVHHTTLRRLMKKRVLRQ